MCRSVFGFALFLAMLSIAGALIVLSGRWWPASLLAFIVIGIIVKVMNIYFKRRRMR